MSIFTSKRLGANDRMITEPRYGRIAGTSLAAIGLLITAGMWGCPQYNVWRARLNGEAEATRAEQNRRIAVMEAQAKLDSSKMLAGAEVERAKGVAEANRIVGESLKGHDEYLRYLWIDKVAGTAEREVVYVPTEANIPILEARPRLPIEAKP